jgi:hypothetical protein
MGFEEEKKVIVKEIKKINLVSMYDRVSFLDEFMSCCESK